MRGKTEDDSQDEVGSKSLPIMLTFCAIHKLMIRCLNYKR